MQEKTEIKYNFSEDFRKFLIESSEGFLSGQDFEKLMILLEISAGKFFFTEVSEANLRRIISSLFDKKSFLLDALKFDHHTEIICAISSYSNYLTDIVVRNPEYLYLVFDQDFLVRKIDDENLVEETKKTVTSFKKLSSKTRVLRNLKRKYLLKIGIADILDFSDLVETTEELSKLANLITSTLFEICYTEIQQKYKIKLSNDYVICSLGKLGGNELNYSSDIDLIIFYDKNFTIESIKKEYHEVISEAIQLFISEATTITAESYLYRVDFRLRPDGRNSLITRTFADYLKYYETRGEEWERQMLIKLGFVCGKKELFDKFKSFLNGFIYSQTFTMSVTETIKHMKKSIEERSPNQQNIKLSAGGIRDIEFAVQALQLINGSKEKNLQTGNTIDAIIQLFKEKLISEEEKNILTNSYITFRKVEHFVQLMNDKQTHTIPKDKDIKYKLTKYLGFNRFDIFEEYINENKSKVRTVYDNILSAPDDDKKKIEVEINFLDSQKADKNYEFLSRGISLLGEKQFDSKTIKSFHNFEEDLLNFLKFSVSPDLVLENFARVIKNIKIPSIWYSSFDDKLFFQSFLKICQFSQKAVDSLITSPKLADHLLSKKVFQKNEALFSNNDFEQVLFSLEVQHALGLIRYPDFSNVLANTISKKISEIITKHELEYSFFLAGLGSFGNSELSFGSDIDLIVVVDNFKNASTAEKDFQNILNELRDEIPQFEIDFRLRPEGKNSPLVTDIDGYKKYLNERVRTWELQALSKCKFVCGNSDLFNTFLTEVYNKVGDINQQDVHEITLSLYRSKLNFGMTSKQKINLKSNSGGLITIDTFVQLLLLLESQLYIKSHKLNGCEKLALALNKLQLNIEKNKIIDNYVFLKNVQIALQNLYNQKKSTIPDDKNKTNNLASYLGFDSSDKLLKRIKSIFSENTKLFNTIKNNF